MPDEGAWRTGIAQGRADEQERIIKILKSLVINEWIEIHLDDLVDLIKMGNK